MYKTLTTLFVILLLPILVFAQDDNVLKDFAKRADDVQSVQVNERLNVVQITYDNNSFDLVGVNDQMQVLWRSQFKGYPFKTLKFKGNVITIASTDYNLSNGPNNTYNAFLIDITTGKVMVQNQIFSNTDKFSQSLEISTGEGNFCRIVVRQRAIKRSLFGGITFSRSKIIKEENATTDLQAFELNDKLEVVDLFKPEIDPGSYMHSTFNNKGNLFISWLDGTTANVYKYEKGKTTASRKISMNIPILDKEGEKYQMSFIASEEDPNVVYTAMIYRNKDKDPELNVGKFDFSNGKPSSVTETFIKKDLKKLEKAFVKVNKKISDPELGLYDIELKYIMEKNGKLVVVTGARNGYTYDGIPVIADFALLINGYDADLNQKSQQLMPIKSLNPFLDLYNGYHIMNDKLYIVANYTSGTFNSHGQDLGIMDLNTGSWDKMDILSKKHVNNSDFSGGDGVMWFKDSYIVPYFNPKSAVSLTRSEITLQLNQY